MAQMKSYKELRPIALWLGALLVGAFALLYFEADLLWKVQQHNVFLNTALFFKQQMVVPGGMLSYMGAFLTQHFYYPWIGVVMQCALWLLLMWLTKRAFNIPEQWLVLTLIPVAILLVANMDLGYWVYVIKLRGYFFVPTLGVIAATALFWAYRQLPEKQWVLAAFVALVALVGYPLMGIYALAAVVLMALENWRKWLVGVVALLCVIVVPLMYYNFVYYETNLIDIYRTALPVFAISDSYPEYYYPYYALALCFLLLTLVSHREWKAPKHPVMDWVKQGVVLAAVVGCVYHFWYKDANFHHELRMQRCVEQADWEGVIAEGAKQEGEPTRSIVMMHNLALSRLGRQCDEMYSFRKGSSKSNTPLPIYLYHVAGRMMLYQYGMMNECHRICMEDGVEYGWNVELLRYMARCAIFCNEKQAARKFLDILRETTYYGSWADHMEALMNNPKQLADDAETGPVARMQHYTDKLDAVEGKVENCIMTTLAAHDADDLYFQEQAVLGAMWTRDPAYFWPRFDHYVQLNGEDKMPPRIFQEAAWLFANMQGMDGLDEWSLEPGVKERFTAFMRLLQQFGKTHNPAIRQELLQYFGNTYYFEYFFLKDITYY
jgi:hypothetical protein